MTQTSIGTQPAEVEGTPTLYVVFKVGGADYALPASTVLQMESYQGTTPVPGTQPFVAGIIQLRGRVVPVVDLRARFGLPPREPTLETRLVVGEREGRAVALVADSAREVLLVHASQLRPPPRLVEAGAKGFVSAVARVGERTLMVLDFDKVIGEELVDV